MKILRVFYGLLCAALVYAGINTGFGILVFLGVTHALAGLLLMRLDVVKDRSHAPKETTTDSHLSTEGTAPSGCA